MKNFENPMMTSENRLPQRSYYIPSGKSEYMLLNGRWRFAFYKNEIEVPSSITSWDTITVPSCWQSLGYENPNYTNINFPYPCDPPYVPDDNPCGIYQKDFELAKKWGRIYFVLEGVSSCAYITVNDCYVGYTQGSHLQAEFDITDFTHQGKNTITVKVLKWCCGSYLEDQDAFRYNGIFRDCYILQRPLNHITDFDVFTEDNEVVINLSAPADITLFDAQERILGSCTDCDNARIAVDSPILWNAEKPYLYTVKIERDEEIIITKTAFRTITVSPDYALLINNTPVKLHGVNHHDTHISNGWCQTDEDLLSDLQLMKDLNINCIRTSHYPPTPKFLDFCDEMGFYVVLETDLETHGFIRRNSNVEYRYDVESNDWPCSNPIWEKEFVERMKRAVIRDRNHPSIIMWSTGNESGFGNNHISMINYLRTLNDSRLIHCEDASRSGNSKFVDVFSCMYPRFEFVEEYAKDNSKKQPFFMCEYSHAMGNGPGDVYDYNELINEYPKLIGGCVWEWADHVVIDKDGVQRYGGDFEGEVTHDGNFCCDGMVFANREFKPGSFEIKTAYQPMRSVYNSGYLKVTNFFDFTDFSECDFIYQIEADGKIITEKNIRINLAPHMSTELSIDIPQNVNCKYGLYLNCYLYHDNAVVAKTQHLITEHNCVRHYTNLPATILENDTEYIICGNDFNYVFSKRYGNFSALKIKDKNCIVDLPRLTAWRAPTDNDGKIKILWGSYDIWQGENLNKLFSKIYDCTLSNGTITVHGSLSGVSRKPFFRYSATFTVFEDGRIEVTLNGKIRENVIWLPRLGFEFTLPAESCDFSYFGYGPNESYCDMHNASSMGLYHSNAKNEYVKYVRPQEHGNHWNTKMLSIGGLNFEGESFEFKVSEYSTEALTNANHTDQLVKDGKIHLRVDYKVSGIGSASCGPELKQEYRLAEKDIAFKFTIRPDKQ